MRRAWRREPVSLRQLLAAPADVDKGDGTRRETDDFNGYFAFDARGQVLRPTGCPSPPASGRPVLSSAGRPVIGCREVIQ
ncbi:hypothetical protein GCM10010510_65430 [Streptomyces anandii JCM 4720]|nr:hypothetical protein GCM10010510_65430 [Streptomyces anandii JCM 4720]